ncbi:MAG: formylglycine-generating enzyme family protein [Nitrospiraceae bacterium]
MSLKQLSCSSCLVVTGMLVMLMVLSTIEPVLGQLDRLRKQRAAPQPSAVEVPMAVIPEGTFGMGSDSLQALEDERPKHEVSLDRFVIDLYEVTTGHYAAFLAADKRPAPWQWESVDLAMHRDRPVIGVDWHDADAYCRWIGKRLPTEAEWEKAARGIDGRLYPWGNQEPTAALANFALGARFSYSQVLMPVDRYEEGRSPFGLYHMAGNVWEWTQDWYGAHYYETGQARNPTGPPEGQFKVLRGGSWSDLPKYLLTYGRFKLPPGTRNSYTGFRCARTHAAPDPSR